tara:strand:- start:30375 stop:33386 length:3012 start_codon:yes stop_codon:yes gene_type:complete
VANRRRTDDEGKYKKRVEEAETYKDIAGVLPGIGTAMTVSDIEDELSKEDPSYLKVGILGASEAAGLIPGVGSAAKTLIRKGVQKLDEVKDLTKNADSNALEQVGLTEEALEAWKAKNYAKDKFRIPPHPKLTEAAEKLRDGKLSQEEYIILSKQIQPIVTIKEMPKFPSKEDVVQALHATDKRKVEKGIIGVNKEIPDGTQISARLDIPAYNDTDTWIVSLHDGTEKSGATVGYAQTAVLTDVKFTTNPLAASAIASGKPKTTIARMNGSYVNADPDDVYNYTKDILENEAEGWTQVGMNPTRASYFYDKSDGMPVVSADEVVQVGPLVMAKNVTKTTPDDVMFQFTNKRTGVTANFSEGGMALEEQMKMNFGDVPDNTIGVDPVSGNEIPMGSTAENVRDDIPTMLSEGEIVVPADVVNYWGVKLFEDLRAQAKMGYAQMEEDGRIGGEPIEDDEDTMGLEMSDLEVMEMPDDMPDVEEAFLGKFFAGLRESNRKAAQQSVRDRFKKAEQRKSVDKIKAGTNKKPKFKNKAEELLYNLRNRNKDRDDRRVTLTEKPPTSDDAKGPSIAEQINFGGDYDKPEKKKAPPKKVKPGGKATPFVDDAPEKEGVNLRSTESFGTKFMRGLGIEGYDEGGQVFQQKGGFDMSEATPIGSTGAVEATEGMTMEARIYVNDAGHEITIMFANGVPITPIPAGYYPKAETVTPETGVQTGGGGGGSQIPEPPEPINYQELSIDELTKEVKDLQTPPPIPGILGALFRGAQERHKAKTMEEIDRRLESEDLAIYEKEYLQNLKEVLEAPQGKGVVGKFIDKLTGQVVEEPNVPTLDGPTYDFMPDSYSITEPYTPEAQTPTVTEQGVDAADFGVMQNKYDEIARIEQELKSQPRPKDYDTSSTTDTQPTPVQQTQQQRNRTRDAGRSARKTFDAFKNDPSKSKSIARNAPAVQRTESVIRDMERGVQRGFEKGGLVDKPTVKKVVKGLEKASKSHAKQADQLKKAMKKKSK